MRVKHKDEMVHLEESEHHRHSSKWALHKVIPVREWFECDCEHSSGWIWVSTPHWSLLYGLH